MMAAMAGRMGMPGARKNQRSNKKGKKGKKGGRGPTPPPKIKGGFPPGGMPGGFPPGMGGGMPAGFPPDLSNMPKGARRAASGSRGLRPVEIEAAEELAPPRNRGCRSPPDAGFVRRRGGSGRMVRCRRIRFRTARRSQVGGKTGRARRVRRPNCT